MNQLVEARVKSTHRALSSYGARVAVLDSLGPNSPLEAAPIGSAMGGLSRLGARMIESFVEVERPLAAAVDDIREEIAGRHPFEDLAEPSV